MKTTWTQTQAARLFGVPLPTLSHYIHNQLIPVIDVEGPPLLGLQGLLSLGLTKALRKQGTPHVVIRPMCALLANSSPNEIKASFLAGKIILAAYDGVAKLITPEEWQADIISDRPLIRAVVNLLACYRQTREGLAAAEQMLMRTPPIAS